MKVKISVVIPVFNEFYGIRKLLKNLIDELNKINLDYKVILIDDGSTDNTFQLVKKYYGSNENITILRHRSNLGVGKAIFTGLKYSIRRNLEDDNGVVITMESDNTSDIELLKRMIDEIKVKKRDITIASRLIKGGGYLGISFIRWFFSFLGNKLFRYLFKIKNVTDYTIFYRAYNASIIKKLFSEYEFPIESKGFSVMLEILLKLNKHPINITEVPFLYNYNLKTSRSKMSLCSTIIDYIKLFLRSSGIFLRGY